MSTVTSLVAAVRRLLFVVATLVRAGMIAPMRPDKYVRLGLVVRRQGTTPDDRHQPRRRTPAARHRARRRARHADLGRARPPDRRDRRLARRADAAADHDRHPVPQPPRPGRVAGRHHPDRRRRAAAQHRLLRTAARRRAGPGGRRAGDLRRGVRRPRRARPRDGPRPRRGARLDRRADQAETVDGLELRRRGTQAPTSRTGPGRIILLTSGTTGTPKGARRSGGGGTGALAAMFDRIPWRAEETVVVAAPMFHAWGFGQLAIAATMACTVVMRRRFDPEATLAMVEEHGATGLAVVPVMLERIVDLPTTCSTRTTSRASASSPRAGRGCASDAVTGVHGPLRRRGLQQLQRHRGRADQHGDAGGPAGRPRHRRPARRRARPCGSSTTSCGR